MELRLAKGDDVEQTDSQGRTSLWLASEQGHTAVVERLLGEGKADANKANDTGETPVLQAAFRGHTSVVRVLLQQGKADADKAASNGFTPLMWAACKRHTDSARLLIELGHAKPNLRNNFGCTALMCAAMEGCPKIITLLIEQAKADVHLVSQYRNTALDLALQHTNLPSAKLLVIHGAEPDLAQYPAATSPTRQALERGLALRAQVAQYHSDRQDTVVGWLETEEGLAEDVGLVVLACEGKVMASAVLQELGISV